MTLDGEQIRALVSEVADELDATGGDAHTIIVVGGSLLAWRGLREATEDVDSIRRLDDELRRAVGAVAARHALSLGWLNDHAAAFAPQGLDVDACDVLLDRPRLRVLGAPMRAVFLMKLNRSLPQDLEDMRSVWPLIRDEFATATEIVEAFFEAFPAEPDDEHLANFVVDELAKGGYDLALE